ncbi:hypothetical protein [Kribbella voronezhensis]|uniref:hypothetical protein n=1 Tax=Kribbella voronezhensis TaxID=2512212 RepID=UPI001EE0E2AF|nr:hypothetical protein [Kribbella voronezhensis]
MTKSRGRDGRGSHLRLVDSSPGSTPAQPPVGVVGTDLDTTPSVAVLETLLETLQLDLAAAPPALHPVIAEASVARSAALLADQLWPAGQPDEIGEVERFFWADAARVLGERRDLESFVLLTSLARTVGPAGRLPLQRAHLSRGRTQYGVPDWVSRIAGFRLTSAIVSEDVSGDGLSVVLDYDDDQHPHTVVVFVDNNQGAIAKDVFVGPPVDRVVEAYQRGGRVTVRTVRPATAAGIILQALGETHDHDDPPVTEDFEFFSGLLVNRLTQLPERPIRPPVRPQLSGRQRDQLVTEFLDSGYASGLPDDAADIARLWIDHAVDRTVGGPLRVSAVLVELFLSYWLPRKVLADSTYFAAVPRVVKAWLEFAGERTALDLATVEEALDAVDVWTPALEAAALAEPIGSRTGERVFLDDTSDDLEDAYRTLAGLGAPPQPDLRGLDKSQAATLTVLAPHAWLLAGETLGTDYAAEAYEIADRLVRDAPDLLTKARLSTWPRAIVWLLAHRHRLVGPGEPLTPLALASELSSSPPTLRKTAKLLTDTLILPR